MNTKEKVLKKIVNHYTMNEEDDLYLKQIDYKIDQLQKQKEQIDSHIDHLKHSLELLKEKKQKITDDIAKLRFKKQKLRLTDKGII